MADARVALPISFSTDCKTPADLARRYRVLAAMSEDGVTFRQSRESLLALANMCDVLADGPWVIVHEVEKPVSRLMVMWLTVTLGLTMVGAVADAATRLAAFLGWL